MTEKKKEGPWTPVSGMPKFWVFRFFAGAALVFSVILPSEDSNYLWGLVLAAGFSIGGVGMVFLPVWLWHRRDLTMETNGEVLRVFFRKRWRTIAAVEKLGCRHSNGGMMCHITMVLDDGESVAGVLCLPYKFWLCGRQKYLDVLEPALRNYGYAQFEEFR